MDLQLAEHRGPLSADAVPLIPGESIGVQQGARSRPLLFWCLPLTLALLVYLPALSGGFVFDDFTNLVDNPAFQQPIDSFAALWEAAWSSPSSTIGRPLGFLSLAVDVALFGLDPWAMKLSSLLLHGLNACLVAALCYRLLDWPGLARGLLSREPARVAGLIALTWAVLAIHLSLVVYVVQRIELLAHTFVFAALLCYLAGRRRMLEGRRGGWWYTLAGMAVLPTVGVLAKETAALTPVYTLALELYALRFAARWPLDRRLLMGIYGVLIVTGTALVLWILPDYWNSGVWAIRNFQADERLLSQARILWDYLRWILLPDPGAMGLYHDAYPVSRGLLAPPSTLAALLGWLAVALWLLWPRGPQPSLARLGVAWFLAGHLLTSSFLPLELVFEHRNYFAALGVLLLLAVALARLAERSSVRAALAVFGLFLLWQGAATAIRASDWGHPIRFAVAEAARNADSPRAQYELGLVLLRASDLNPASPLYGQAMAAFERAAGLPEASPLPEQGLLIAATRAGQTTDPAWWDSIQHKALHASTGPQYVRAFVTLASCATQSDCPLPPERLAPLLATAASRTGHPDLLLAYANYALSVLGDGGLALRLAEDAVAADPGNPNRHYMLGQYRAVLGDLKGARASADRMRQLDPLGRQRSREQALRRLIEDKEAAQTQG